MTARRALLVGGGWAARELWGPRLARHARFDLVGVVDPRSVGGLLADLPRYPSLAEVPPGHADLAVVAVPNHLHVELAHAALDRHMDVFVEKPTGTTSDEVASLARRVGASGRHVVPSTAARHRTDVRALRDLVDAGALGAVELLTVAWVRAAGVPQLGGWFTHRRTAGGGALLDLGWHLLDVALWIAGMPAVVRAAGHGSSSLLDAGWGAAWRDDASGLGLTPDVEAGFDGFVETTGPGIAVRAAWASHQPIDVTTIEVRGADGVATLTTTFGFSPRRVEVPRLVVRRRGEDEEVVVPPAAVGEEYDAALDELDAVLAGTPLPDRVEDARLVMDAVEALYGRTAQ